MSFKFKPKNSTDAAEVAEPKEPRAQRMGGKVSSRVAGPAEEAAIWEYFERSSKPFIERNHWRLGCLLVLGVAAAQAVGIASMLPLKTYEAVQVTQDQHGRMQAGSVAGKLDVTDEAKMVWTNNWLIALTEVAPGTWEHNVEEAISKSAGAGTAQVNATLRVNNPADLKAVKFRVQTSRSGWGVVAFEPSVLSLAHVLVTLTLQQDYFEVTR